MFVKNKREVFSICVATVLVLGFQNCTYLNNPSSHSVINLSFAKTKAEALNETRKPSNNLPSKPEEKPTFFFQVNNSPYFRAM